VRRAAAAVLAVLGAVLPAVAVTSWWAYGEATDTARFTKAARPLATDAAVQRAVADQLVATAETRLGAAGAAVPGVPAAVRARLRAVARALVTSEAYRRSWLATQRAVHGRLAARLAGNVDAPLTLDLARVAAVLRARLAARGLPQVAQALESPPPVTLADRRQVRRAHDAAEAVRVIRAVSVPAAVLALVGVLLTAGALPAGLLRVAACIAASTVLLVAGRAVAHQAIANRDTSGGVAVAVYDVLSRPLRTWVVAGAGAAVLFGAAGAVAHAAGPGAARRR
jgi:hypothetical protein